MAAGKGYLDAGTCRIGPPERSAFDGRAKWPLTVCSDYCHGFYPKEESEQK